MQRYFWILLVAIIFNLETNKVLAEDTEGLLKEQITLCESCHGAKGSSQDPQFPILAGQHFYYIYVQLKDLSSGMRKNEIMNDIAASYQSAVVDVLITKLKNALELTAINTCVIAGGVSANKILRESAIIHLAPAKVHFPSLPLCTDNAAMVAYLGELKLDSSKYSSLSFPVLPNLSLT